MLYVNPLTVNRSLSGSAVESPERRKQALKEFEHLLAFQLLREMRKTVPKNELLGSNNESDFYSEMMDDFLAGQMAKSGQLGVAKLMEEQLMRNSVPLPRGAQGSGAEALLQESRKAAIAPINIPASANPLPRAEN